jgi:hypothetical protein
MKFMMHMNKDKYAYIKYGEGFIATTAVMVIAGFSLFFILTTISIANEYADNVSRREWRIQANFNAESCLSTVAIMAAKDYFLDGKIEVYELGCSGYVKQDHINKTIEINTSAVFNGVHSQFFYKKFITF